MAQGRRIDDETYEAIKAGLAADSPVAELAARYGISPATVYRINNERLSGVVRPAKEQPKKSPKLDPEQTSALLAEYAENHLTAYAIGQRYGVSEATVHATAKRAGVVRAGGKRSADSPVVLKAGAWVYDKYGVARWVAGAVPGTTESEAS